MNNIFSAGLPRQTPAKEFVASFFSGSLVIGSGASGEILKLVAPRGKRVKLLHLAASTTTEPSVTVEIDGKKLIQATLGNSNSTGGFLVGHQVYATSAGGGVGSIQLNSVGPAKVIRVLKSGATTQTICFSYAYGD